MYCPGVGNLFPSLCTPGYYNDLEGQNACIERPLDDTGNLAVTWRDDAGDVDGAGAARTHAAAKLRAFEAHAAAQKLKEGALWPEERVAFL